MMRRSVTKEVFVRALPLCLLLLTAVVPSSARAQRPYNVGRDSVVQAAAALLNSGRGNEARILLQTSARASTSPQLRAVYRLHVADSYLYDGQYTDAMRVYGSVLSGEDAKGVDSLTSWAHRGLGVAEAFTGRNTQAAAHLAEALSAPVDPRYALSDSIEMLVVTGQHDAAAKALDRLEQTVSGEDGQQYVHTFRALNTVLSGHCTAALEALQKAPDGDRPMPRTVRGRCFSKRGQKVQAIALRDSVLKQPMPDPFAWPMIIVRDAARKIR